jgi:hypothetical protein
LLDAARSPASFWQTALAVITGPDQGPPPRFIKQAREADSMKQQQGISVRSQGVSPGSNKLVGAISAAALLSTVFLGACGSGAVDDLADEIADALVCGLSNCKQSDSLRLEDISPRYQLTQQNGQVRVDARLGQSANVVTVVQPSGADHLSASIGNQRRDLADQDGKRKQYSVLLADASEQPTVSVNFVRGSELHTSTVSFPKPFALVAPTGTPMIARSAGKFLVQMSQPYANQMALSVSMACKRADGSSFTSKEDPLAHAPEAGNYRIGTLDLDATLNRASLNANSSSPSLVQSCELTFQWTLRQSGTLAATLSRHGSIVAERSISQTASYDARL